VLELCNKAGLVKLGTVSLDGTRVKANASLKKSVEYKTLCRKEEELRKKVEEMLEKAERTDEEEDRLYGDRRGDELPEGFHSKKEQLRRIREAKKQVEEEKRKRDKEYSRKLEGRAKKEEREGKKIRGRKPKLKEKKTKRNTTDPDSRIMKTRSGYLQGYNAQVIVDAETQVIVATDIVQDENDKHQQSMLYRVEENTGRKPNIGLLDNGYWDEKELRKIEESGIELYVATTSSAKLSEMRPPISETTYKDRMERKLLTKEGKEIYKKRSTSVEPVFGQIKNRISSLLLRGLEKVKGEWTLISITHNILKLWRANLRSCIE